MQQPTGPDSMAGALGTRVTRDTGIYTSAGFITFALALINVAVITRFLSPSEFGQLALLLVFAAFLTIFYNLGSLQGTFMWVFGAAGEEDVEDVSEQSAVGEKRRALGTGLIITSLVSALGTAAMVALAGDVAELLLGDRSQRGLVMIAAASAAMGAVWRLVSNVLRLERRPRGYVALSALRPVLVVGAVIPLVASGGGVEGALAGTAIGSGAAVAIGLVVIHRSFEFSFHAGDARTIMRRGAIFVPIIVSFWIAQNVDLFALSRFAPDDEVGLYRLAGRIGAFVAYFTGAVFMAWTPLQRTSTFAAAQQELGREALGGRLLTYFALGGILLVLGLTVTADGLVRIAPPAYADAAPLIPLLAGGFLAHGLLVAVYRVSSFPRKRWLYVASAMVSAAVFLGAALVLIPWLGATGAALSVIVGFLVGAGGMLYLSQTGPSPVRVEYRRIAAGFLLAGGCFILARGVGAWAGPWQPAVEVVALILYPVLLVATGIIPRDELEAIKTVLRAALPRRRRRLHVADRLRSLPPEDFAGLELAIRRQWTIADLASLTGAGVPETHARLARALGRLTGWEGRDDHDARIGEYLFSELPVADRDVQAREMWADVNPADLHRLEEALEQLRRLPGRAWDDLGD